jgi:hypothetical protein
MNDNLDGTGRGLIEVLSPYLPGRIGHICKSRSLAGEGAAGQQNLSDYCFSASGSS